MYGGCLLCPLYPLLIVRGSIIRSRATWYGERNTKYFKFSTWKTAVKRKVTLGNHSFQMENRPQMLMSYINEMYINFYSDPFMTN